MANTRKVLINRHSTKPQAPSASEMFHGEIAVSHPENLSATTIYTRNGDVMIPFASCAMTMQMIDNAISAADVSYDVKATEGEAFINVGKSVNGSAVTFTVSSEDIQSKDAFDAYSAETKTKIDNITSAVDTLTDIVITGVSGDSIIVAEVLNPTTRSNEVNLAHKQALATDGFKKLTTDAYGHVTAAADVTTEDIQALGFKTSAQTGEDLEALSASVVTNKANIEALSAGTIHDIETLSGNVVEHVKVVSGNIETVINELSAGTIQLSAGTHNAIAKLSADTEAAIAAAIEGLDSDSATTDSRHYVTAITIENGKIVSFEEATDPQLSVESAGIGNVVSQITVADHKISYTTTSVATSEDIQKLSAATMSLSGVVGDFSAATDTKFNGLSAYTEDVDGKVIALSGATVAGFNSAFTAIQGMDKDADAVAGQVVTTVSEVDGVVSEAKANVKDLQLGGYSKDTTATGDIASTDTINTALSKLENKANANAISNADGSINVNAAATGTDINVNIKTGEKVLAKNGAAGLYTDLDLVKITTGLPATVKERYQLLATDDSQIGVDIDVPKDSHIVSINYVSDPADAHYQNLEYKYIDAEGTEQTTYVDVSSLVLEAEFASGVTVTNHIAHGVVDPQSETFLTVGAAGFKLSGVQDAIDSKVNALDVTGDTAAAGQYVAAIEQTDGLVAVKTRANVSEAVLNNYAKGSDATAVAATDNVNQAISKLENQIDKAKDAATTKVVEGTDAGNNMTITPTTGADGSVTYTVDLADVASKAALDAEIAARKAVDGQNGDTYAANSSANYISGATSLNDADVKLDAAVKGIQDALDGLDVTDTAEAGKYVSEVNETDGKVSMTRANVSEAPLNNYEKDDDATSITSADTINGAVNKLENKIDVLAKATKLELEAIADTIENLDSVGSASTTGHYLTSVTITNGKISAVGEQELPAATPVTTVNGTTGTTVAPVLTGIVTGGTEGHALTLNYTNKVLSAQTADEAAHASAATKVDQKLTFADDANDVEYDGSQAKTITFGTAVTSTGLTGRSMSITDGVVDVEIIDCGEY